MARILLICLLSCLLSPPSFAADPAITGFRAADKKQATRFVLDLTRSTSYRSFTLQNPPRVVIDIPNGSWDDNIPPLNDTKRIRSVRHFKHADSLRVVLDLAADAVSLDDFMIAPKDGKKSYRLVLDIATSDTQPLEADTPSPITREGESVAAPLPVLRPRRPLIVIDAGHGGHDPGATGRKGTQEKYLTLAYAMELEKQLLATRRYDVVMTREKDVYISLPERVNKARAAKGDLFVSLHANTHENEKMEGLSVYTLSEVSSDKEAEALAQKENKAGLINGVNLNSQEGDLAAVFIEMTQRETKNLSASFAESILEKMEKDVKLLRNPHRYAGFRVLKGVDIPSVLVELGYVTNRREEKLLRSDLYREQVTAKLIEAIDDHFATFKIE